MNKLDSCYIIEHLIFGENAYGQSIRGITVICIAKNNCSSIQEYLKKNEDMLAPKEREYLLHIKSERRLESFLLGRVSAKHAYSKYNKSKGFKRIQYSDLQIEYSCTGKPLLVEKERVSECQLVVTHSETVGISLVSDRRFLLGIDLEWKNKRKSESARAFLSPQEQDILNGIDEQEIELLFWSAKEALGKYLGIGLSANPTVFDVEKVCKQGKFYEVSFSNFTRHKVIGYNSKEFILALAYYDRVSLEELESMMNEIIECL